MLKRTVTLVMALIESDRLNEAQARLDAAIEVDAAMRSGLQDRIETKRLMRQ